MVGFPKSGHIYVRSYSYKATHDNTVYNYSSYIIIVTAYVYGSMPKQYFIGSTTSKSVCSCDK